MDLEEAMCCSLVRQLVEARTIADTDRPWDDLEHGILVGTLSDLIKSVEKYMNTVQHKSKALSDPERTRDVSSKKSSDSSYHTFQHSVHGSGRINRSVRSQHSKVRSLTSRLTHSVTSSVTSELSPEEAK